MMAAADAEVTELGPDVWMVRLAGAVRIVRHRGHDRTFAPWDICTADQRRLWATASLASAIRWIQRQSGYPVEAVLADGLRGDSAGVQDRRASSGGR